MTGEGGGNDQVGSVAEEAAKLLHALQGWAREGGAEHSGAAATAATGAAGAFKELNAHIATGDDCRYCPVCRAIALVRETSPEVKAHLASAATSLMQAAATAMATHVPDQAREGRADQRVEKIDLSDDNDEWGDE